LALLETIALKAQSFTAAEFAAVAIGSDPHRAFDTFAFTGLSHEIATKIGRHPRPIGLLGLVAKQGHVIRCRDLHLHPEHRGFPFGHPIMTSLIGVPIRFNGRAVGNLYVANKREADEFTDEDQRRLEMLAEDVGVAIETVRLYSAEGARRVWLQTVIDQMPEGVVLMDTQGRVTLENRFIRSLAAGGTRPSDRFGNRITLDLRHLCGEPVAPDAFPIVKAIINKETIQGCELVARKADGRMVPLLVDAAPIQNNSELIGATMILQDISTLKDVEHRREEWSAMVAHDLKQPLQSLLVRTGLLMRGSLSAEQEEQVRQIRHSIQLLGRMVSDLTDASQLEANRMRLILDRLDLGALLQEIVNRDLNAKARTRVQTPSTCRLFVQGDAQRLEQVVTNLLSNDLKYGAPDTEIQLEVSVFGGHAKVSVMNWGPGIPAHELYHIFERYARSHEADTIAPMGLGLGLYIARGIVEAHGGRMWAESVPDKTTTFHFTIPLDGPPMGTPPAVAGL
jgi:signal transduction histidine kinase